MDVEALRQQYVTDGYVVVRNVFDKERAARLRAICDKVLEQWRVRNPETGEPGGKPDATVMRHLNHPGYFAEDPAQLGELMEAVADEKVLTVALSILGEDPLFRCTSYFFNPLSGGRDGNWHRDSQFTTDQDEDERKIVQGSGTSGLSVQMQIALVPSEDVEYVPGSHLRWDTPEEYRIRKAEGGKHNTSNQMPGAVRLALEPGDAALFNPLGLHRGRYHTHRVRRTLMLTYTKTSYHLSDYFSHQPWFLEPDYMERLSPSTRQFFEEFVNAYRADWQQELA